MDKFAAPLVRECRYLAEPPVLARGPSGAEGAQAPGAPADLPEEPLGRVKGYAALFNTRSENLGFGEHAFYEEIRPGAFDNLSYENVVALFNHDYNLPLARHGVGLDLGIDTRGLWYEFELPDTTLGRDLRELLGKGIISQSSFAFTVEEDGQEWAESAAQNGSVSTRTITRISALYDISLVTRPAYADTTVALRSLYAHRAAHGQQKLPLSARELAPALRAEVYALTGIGLSAPR